MTPGHGLRPGTSVRPTARAIVVLVSAVALWILADLTRVMPARVLAAALLLTLVIGGARIGGQPVPEEIDPAAARGRVDEQQVSIAERHLSESA